MKPQLKKTLSNLFNRELLIIVALLIFTVCLGCTFAVWRYVESKNSEKSQFSFDLAKSQVSGFMYEQLNDLQNQLNELSITTNESTVKIFDQTLNPEQKLNIEQSLGKNFLLSDLAVLSINDSQLSNVYGEIKTQEAEAIFKESRNLFEPQNKSNLRPGLNILNRDSNKEFHTDKSFFIWVSDGLINTYGKTYIVGLDWGVLLNQVDMTQEDKIGFQLFLNDRAVWNTMISPQPGFLLANNRAQVEQVSTTRTQINSAIWTLELTVGPDFGLSSFDKNLSPVVLLIGGLLSLGMFFKFFFLTVSRDQFLNLSYKTNESLTNRSRQLEEQRARDEALISSINEGLIIADITGKIVMTNATAQELLGVSEEDMIEKIWGIDIPQAIDSKAKKINKDNLEIYRAMDESQKISSNYFFSRKNEQIFPVQSIATPIMVGDRVIGAVLIFRDISKDSSINSAKNDFVSIASHQLRTPLSNLRWTTELLLEAYTKLPPQEVHKNMESIYNNTVRMIDLVNDLLNVSKIEQGLAFNHPSLMSFSQLVDEVWTHLDKQASSKNLSLTKNLPIENDKIYADPKLLREVLENLLSNAIKYSFTNHTVTIEAEWQKHTLQISIIDHGIGIHALDKEQLFNKFFRGQNALLSETEGSGLGLFIARAYVQSWGGRIWFESLPGKGSMFTFTIPNSWYKEHSSDSTDTPSTPTNKAKT